MDKIKLGISSCLLGENVRYDGRHKFDQCLKDTLGELVEWIGVCPEVECGLGVPREAMYLTDSPESPRLITKITNIDHTDKMLKWAGARLEQLEKEKLAGFIFKSGSPSCGLKEVLSEKRTGIFAKKFIAHFKLMPVEDSDSLRDDKIREKFVKKTHAFRKASSSS
ncbi:MAG: hypothetical protein CO035_05460 [Candidatus Omnitrophica bacterium CG_4_9_14_0_2_um_filter_42_8]|nr:MAG: hypothetical protein COW92_04700 [Candidatus Omnitrophica bacterium CG22_combo_CG10-13_8_21_14_all_43_16]PJC47900.1 MAG: hypothetical protein CO035_05460 [Candidatus Omnitrophica bacterium CG_4_9_14_0_2_um_filter_42_8]